MFITASARFLPKADIHQLEAVNEQLDPFKICTERVRAGIPHFGPIALDK